MSKKPDFGKARGLIYDAHNQDPNQHTTADGKQVPYETHYATKMEKYLEQRDPKASDVLRLAVCGQHFRRWEVPRSDYSMNKAGYYTWRTHLKRRQAQMVTSILKECGYSDDDVKRCEALIEKQALSQGEEEVQALEDVACLVFLDDQFDEFREKHNEEKIVNILRKTWVKMSKQGQDLALKIAMTDECRALVEKALAK